MPAEDAREPSSPTPAASPGVFDLREALRRMAVTASRVLGFETVVVNLRQPNGAYEVIAEVAPGQSLLGTEISAEVWEAFLSDEYKVHNSYLLPPEHTIAVLRAFPDTPYSLPDLPPATEPGLWDPYHFFIVPLRNRAGEMTGFFSMDAPTDGRLPGPERISYIETFAEHAALAVENAQLFERLQAEAKALRRSEERYALVARATNDVIWDWDPATDELTWSTSLQSVFGYAACEVGRCLDWWQERIHPDDEARVISSMRAAIRAGVDVWSSEYRFRRKDGAYAAVIDRGYIVRGADGRPVRMIGSMLDISDRKALEEQLAHNALHDRLTGLPNRTLLLDRVEQALARADRSGRCVAVLFLDLDRFKVVNDSLGHDAGDELLVEAARRLRAAIRPEDTVARLGGDEFAILLDSLGAPEEARAVADRLVDELSAPVRLGSREVFTTASVGIALNAGTRRRPGEFLRRAELAMYRAKEGGRSRCAVYRDSMNARAVRRLEMENDLRRAIERGEFHVLYQPKVHLATGATIGAEALVRWRHPMRGPILPAEFIPIAEETGLILPIGSWVLAEACRQASAWAARDGGAGPLLMCVNLSARQFSHPDLVAEVACVTRASGLAPERLCLEITESVVMEDARANVRTLRRLKELGVRLAIDDFGTGYSSLSYLKRFPVDALKIDKSFVDGLGRDPEDTAIVEAVVTLARSLGLRATAEGVETAQQVERLRALGCDTAQGYLFARPLSATALEIFRRHAPAPLTRALSA